jgi:ABC-type nitrate/sulfonate/bicarbonate transport system permease component
MNVFNFRGVVIPLCLLAFAEFAMRITGLQSDTLATPSAVLVAGAKSAWDGTAVAAIAQTLASATAGLAIGFASGLAAGIALGLVRPLDRLLEVTVELIRPVPSVAFIPIALLIFGFGYRMEIATIAFAVVWPTLVLVRSAVAGVPPGVLEVAQVLRLGFAARVIKIVIPAALPRIFVALRLGVGVALIVAVTVEISANTIGIGYAMMDASRTFHPDLMLAFLMWIGILGWALNRIMLAAQRSLFVSTHADTRGA